MEDSFRRIKASVIEGRAQTPRYIQRQLLLLHDSLVRSQSAIRQAIQQDTHYTAGEIDAEIYLTVKELKREYEAIDLPQALHDEYSLAHLNDHASRRVAVGCVYIIPSLHTRFYSTVQPLAAAIAAGNCVMVELDHSGSKLDSILYHLLSESIDPATVAVVAGKPHDGDFFTQHCVVVDSRDTPGPARSPGPARTLLSPSTRCIAVVDRSTTGTGIAHAAREIVRARFGFDGKSPYAPDLVLVNEFVVQRFSHEAVQYASSLLAGDVKASVGDDGEPAQSLRRSLSDKSSAVQELESVAEVSVLVSGSRGKILHVPKRAVTLLDHKVLEPALIIHPMRSLDDGIDLLEQCSQGKPHLATYFFCNAATAKYLGQFIPSHISFTNSIPIELLVGPSAPVSLSSSQPTSIQPRHPKELFSYPSPQYISPREDQDLLCSLLDSPSPITPHQIHEAVSKPLKPMKQGSGAALGFFEQGLLVGATVGLLGLVSLVTVAVKYVGPAVVRTVKGK